MVKYAFYLLAAVYAIYLIFYLVTFTKTAPAGDAIGWSRNIFYSAGLLLFLVVGLLFWKRPNIGLIILCVPLLFLAYPIIRRKMTDLYAVAPPLKSVPPLTLTIQNTTKAIVHVKLSCYFGTDDKGTFSLYKTMDYMVDPLQTTDTTFNQYETNLLASKSKFINVMMYEQLKIKNNDVSYMVEVQPCMQFYDEQIDAFSHGTYTIVIDSTKNTQTFKDEVEHRKKENYYDNGAF